MNSRLILSTFFHHPIMPHVLWHPLICCVALRLIELEDDKHEEIAEDYEASMWIVFIASPKIFVE